MEPITTALSTAKEIYEAAKTIQKIYNVSKEMKSVAESEGKDQIMATRNLAGSAAGMKYDVKSDGGDSSGKGLKTEGDMNRVKKNESLISKGDFVDKLEQTINKPEQTSDTVKFVDKLTSIDHQKDLHNMQSQYVDVLSSGESNDIGTELSERKAPLESSSVISDTDSVEQNSLDSTNATEAVAENKSEGITEDEKQDIKEKTGWSDKVVDNFRTKEEAQVYIDANLKEVNGNLERTDIDWNAKIPQDRIDRMRSLYGDEVADKWADKTNLDLIKEGKAPYGSDGQQVNLHHIGQKSDSPLAELTNTEHKQNDGVLHDKTKSSEIERPVFRTERQQYWIARYESLTQQA